MYSLAPLFLKLIVFCFGHCWNQMHNHFYLSSPLLKIEKKYTQYIYFKIKKQQGIYNHLCVLLITRFIQFVELWRSLDVIEDRKNRRFPKSHVHVHVQITWLVVNVYINLNILKRICLNYYCLDTCNPILINQWFITD